jgi:hypothetical protein
MVKIKVLNYELVMDESSPFSLGELSKLKKCYGVTGAQIEQLGNPSTAEETMSDPDVMGGIIFTLIKRAHPELDDNTIVAQVAGITTMAVETEDEQPAAGGDPTRLVAADDASPATGVTGS